MAQTKSQLIKSVASACGYSEKSVQAVIDTFLNGVAASLERGEDVKLYGFGSLVLKPRPARTVRLYGKDEKHVPAHYYPVFEPGGALKDAGRELAKIKPVNEALKETLGDRE